MILEVPILLLLGILAVIVPRLEPFVFNLLPIANYDLEFCNIGYDVTFKKVRKVTVKYSYIVSKVRHSSTRHFLLAFFSGDTTQIESTIRIRYLPVFESVSFLESKIKFRSNQKIGLVIGLSCFIGAYFIYWTSTNFPEYSKSLF